MRGAAEAGHFLQDLGINTLPVNPLSICKQLKIEYREDPFNGFDGMLVINPRTGKSLLAVNSRIDNQGRKNFTIAHELGHYCLDGYEQQAFCCTGENIETFSKCLPEMELRANEFAAELLMPRLIYQGLVDRNEPGWDSVKKLAVLSDTSLTSTAKRYMDLTDEACCFIVSRKGQMISFHKSEAFDAYVPDGILSTGTIAHDVFKGIPPPDYFEEIETVEWLPGLQNGHPSHLLEWTLPVNSYGLVFTILFDIKGELGWESDDFNDEWEPPSFHKNKRK